MTSPTETTASRSGQSAAKKPAAEKAAGKKLASRKPIKVLRRRKVLHIGIDLARAPWTGTLIRALPANIENHAERADDATAALLQLHRPKFPPIDARAGPGALNRMARVMANYDLVITHGDHALRAVMAHTLFGQGVKAPPLVHITDTLGRAPGGWWNRFRHKLALARTPLVIAPTAASAQAMTAGFDVPRARIAILPPLFPLAPRAAPKADAIPRLLKREGERWIAVRADDSARLAPALTALMARLGEEWHLVVLGAEGDAADLRHRLDDAGVLYRAHFVSRLAGPAGVAGLFDLAIVSAGADAGHAAMPPDLPALMAAGVPLVAVGPEGLGQLLPAESAACRVAPREGAALEQTAWALAADAARLSQVGEANAAFAARHADALPWLAALAGVLGLASLEER